jgi:hypothetical protein
MSRTETAIIIATGIAVGACVGLVSIIQPAPVPPVGPAASSGYAAARFPRQFNPDARPNVSINSSTSELEEANLDASGDQIVTTVMLMQ